MLSLADVIDAYRVVEVDEMIGRCTSDIDTVADVLEIDRNYLSVQVRLHIPHYPSDEIRECTDASIVRQVLKRLRESLDSFGEYNQAHRELNGIDSLPEGCRVQGRAELSICQAQEFVRAAKFGDVPASVGLGIQERLHYIHKAREDTSHHTGLFLEGYSEPICYAAFSSLDRQYLINGLNAKGLLDCLGIAKEQVAVMTRAFGFSPLPANAMSKLFDRSCALLRQDGFRLLVTAVNPYLSFRGSIFSGSSFVPFATSPMRYWYSDTGHYLNRRSSESALPQRCDTPPILWLVRGLDTKLHKAVEKLDMPLYNVEAEEYANG
jgi:hypothetical protein